MVLELVPQTDTFDQWRQKTNSSSIQININTEAIGDLDTLDTADKSSTVEAINEVQTNIARVEAIAAGGKNIQPLILMLG